MKRLLGRAFMALAQLCERSRRASVYIAAGLTSVEQLRNGVAHRWAGFSHEDEQIDSGLMPWEAALAERYVKPGARVLIVGCGTGRDVIPLARIGCSVVGVDPAGPAVDVGRRALAARGLSAELRTGFFEDLEWNREFDVVWFSYFAYSLIPGAHRRVSTLKRAAAALRPGGRLLVSAFGSPPQERLSAVGTAVARLTGNDWILSKGDNVVVQPGAVYLLFEHSFSQHELRGEFRDAGLRVVHVAEFGTVFALEPV